MSGPLPAGVRDVPTIRQQAIESAREAECGLDREVGEVVKREKERLSAVLLLPCRRPVGAHATQHYRSVWAFRELNAELTHSPLCDHMTPVICSKPRDPN